MKLPGPVQDHDIASPPDSNNINGIPPVQTGLLLLISTVGASIGSYAITAVPFIVLEQAAPCIVATTV